MNGRRGLGALAILIAATMTAWPFLFPDPLFYYFDDFYYYTITAQHFLQDGRFAFFPGMVTNGFHPLWMGVVVAAMALTGGGAGFYAVISLIDALLALIVLRQATGLARDCGAREGMAVAGGWLAFAASLSIGVSGLEVALAVPLLLGLLRRLRHRPLASPGRACVTGLLAAATVLARLDAVLLLLPVGGWFLWCERGRWRRFLPLALGTAPLWVYLAANRAFTGMWLPVSGSAKHLRHGVALQWEPFRCMMFTNGPLPALIGVLFMLLFALAMFRLMRRGADGYSIAYGVGLLLFYLVQCSLSDWQLWYWYFYPFVAVAPIAAAALSPGVSSLGSRALGCIAACLLLAMLGWLVRHARPEHAWIYHRSQQVAPFIMAHPGRYAMGDRTGTLAAMVRPPILQLEGLVGDAAFLEKIRDREPLGRVLRDYRIDYYIAAEGTPDGHCLRFREPAQAGAASPVMEGVSCVPPVFTTGPGVKPLWIYRARDIR